MKDYKYEIETLADGKQRVHVLSPFTKSSRIVDKVTAETNEFGRVSFIAVDNSTVWRWNFNLSTNQVIEDV